jgi:HlyD family secretion protein
VAKNYISLADRDTAIATEASANAAVVGADAGIKLAQAALEKAQLDLKNSVVLSPVDGIVIARNVELGQAVVASFQAPNLFTIAEDLSKMQVLANVDEADIGHARVGETAEFTVDAFRGKRFYGRVGQIRNAAQTVSNVVTYIVVIDVNNKDFLLRPGMTANVRLEVARRKDVLLIPSAALRFKPRLDQGNSQGGGSGASADSRRGGFRRSGEGREGRGRDDEHAGGGDHAGGGGHSGGDGKSANGGGGLMDFLERGSPATIYIAKGDEAEQVPITIGISDGLVTEVKDGLNEGQSVVVDTFRASAGGAAAAQPQMGPRPPGMGGGFRGRGL